MAVGAVLSSAIRASLLIGAGADEGAAWGCGSALTALKAKAAMRKRIVGEKEEVGGYVLE